MLARTPAWAAAAWAAWAAAAWVAWAAAAWAEVWAVASEEVPVLGAVLHRHLLKVVLLE